MDIQTLCYAAAALIFVSGLAVAIGRIARNAGLSERLGARRIVVTERLTVDPRRRLLLLNCDGREVLVLTGPRDLVIGWLDNSGQLP